MTAHVHQSGVWEAGAGGFGSWDQFRLCEECLISKPKSFPCSSTAAEEDLDVCLVGVCTPGPPHACGGQRMASVSHLLRSPVD